MVKLVVLEEENDSEWVAPSFAQPKAKTNWVRLLRNFFNLNRQLKRKPCPVPEICEMLINLEWFQYATSLDLNMGYYHICLSEEAINLYTIILPWVKYKYKFLTMGVCNYPDIFQARMN